DRLSIIHATIGAVCYSERKELSSSLARARGMALVGCGIGDHLSFACCCLAAWHVALGKPDAVSRADQLAESELGYGKKSCSPVQQFDCKDRGSKFGGRCLGGVYGRGPARRHQRLGNRPRTRFPQQAS